MKQESWMEKNGDVCSTLILAPRMRNEENTRQGDLKEWIRLEFLNLGNKAGDRGRQIPVSTV